MGEIELDPFKQAFVEVASSIEAIPGLILDPSMEELVPVAFSIEAIPGLTLEPSMEELVPVASSIELNLEELDLEPFVVEPDPDTLVVDLVLVSIVVVVDLHKEQPDPHLPRFIQVGSTTFQHLVAPTF